MTRIEDSMNHAPQPFEDHKDRVPKVLLIARWMWPAARIGALRPSVLANRLPAKGWNPIVLTTPLSCLGAIDEHLRTARLGWDVHEVACRSLWDHAQLPTATLPLRAIARLTQHLVPLDSSYPWVRGAVRKGIELVRRQDIDLIWATSPVLSNLEVARRIAAATGRPYLADIRDVGLGGSSNSKGELYERLLFSEAAGICFNSPAQRPALLARHPELSDTPYRVIYNGFDPTECIDHASISPTPHTLLGCGSLYGGLRDSTALLQALRHRKASGAVPLRLLHYGGVRQRHLLDSARALGVESQVEMPGELSRPEFLQACIRAQVLVLLVGRDTATAQHQGAIPGKLYDYLAAGRPILVLGPENCIAGEIVKQASRGIYLPNPTPQAIAQALETLTAAAQPEGIDLSLQRIAAYSQDSALTATSAFFSEVAALDRPPCARAVPDPRPGTR